MRLSNILKRDRTQNRIPLLLIALFSAIWLVIHGLPQLAGRQNSGENAVTNSANAPLPAALLEALARHDTPTICNALEIVAPERRLIGYTTRPLVCPLPDLPPPNSRRDGSLITNTSGPDRGRASP